MKKQEQFKQAYKDLCARHNMQFETVSEKIVDKKKESLVK